MILEILQENQERMDQDPKRIQADLRKAQMSKMKSLTSQLQNLLQKKIRLDLEIRNTRKKLSKLKTASKNTLKVSLELEGLDLSSEEPISRKVVLEVAGEELTKEFFAFDRVLDEVELVLSSTKDLPLAT